MDLLVIGINHKTAPVAVRERVAFTPDQLGHALHDLRVTEGLEEVAILSTCNRTEIYAVHPDHDHGGVAAWLANYHNIPLESLSESLYVHTGQASVRHLLRVASGLDSMVLGEPQILGQVKDCFNQAKTHRTLGSQLERLSQNTFRIAKRVRTSTAIGQTPVSVASIAVDLASQLFSNFAGCNVMLIGAGETIELVGKHLRNAGVSRLVIANRTLANAETLAEILDGDAATLGDIPDLLVHTDILIASTGSQLPILGKGTVESALKQRRHKPIFMVDLAVPRDIEPEIAELRDVYLYGIDDLEQIIAENISNREEAAREAEAIIDNALAEIEDEDKSRDALDVLVSFRNHHESLKQGELEKALQRLAKGEAPETVLTSLANQLTNKIIHTPSVQIKLASTEGRNNIVDAVCELFQLDERTASDSNKAPVSATGNKT
ncbi:MAG: glutamyl-tRNA reductase [Pseudomonadota bacterium]